jgi:SsrA-binding protein
MPTLAVNKKARFDYDILDKFEAGIVLSGQEVKSARSGRLNLIGSRVGIIGGQPVLIGAQIAPYERAGKLPDYDPQRTRKLLLHQRELKKLAGKLEEKGLTIVPISAYTKGPFIKVEIGVARGKKQYEKRETIKKRDIDREIRSRMSHKR